MNAGQLTSALNTIIDTIRSKRAKEASVTSKTMEDVLLTYGDDHNLAPAQVERLGQLLNNSISMSHHKYAGEENRGDAFELVDVPALMDRYQDPGRARTKVASGGMQLVLPQWQRVVLERDAAGQISKTPTTAEVDAAADRGGGWQKAASELIRHRYNIDELMEEANTALLEVDKGMRKLAHLVNSDHTMNTFDEVMQDICWMSPTTGAAVGEELARRVGAERRKVANDTRDFFHDRHNIQEIVEHVADRLEFRQACHELRDELEKEAAGSRSRLYGDDDEEGTSAPPQPDVEPDDGGDFEEIMKNPKRKPVDQGTPQEKKKEEKVPVTWRDPYVPRFQGGAKPDTPSGGDPDLFETLFGSVSDTAGGMGSALGALGRGAQGLQGAVSMANPGVTARNTADNYAALFGPGLTKTHDRVNGRLALWRQASVLQHMLVRDPVLSRMDPSRVRETFEALRAYNPAVAQDANAARILLREAMQYEGLPLQTLKTLKDLGRAEVRPTKPQNA